MRDVLPRKQADMMRWARNFSARLDAAPGPEQYGVTAAEAAGYAALLVEAESAFRVANRPETRTTPAVARKDTALAALAAQSRVLVRVVKARPSVSDDQRMSLGIALRKQARRTPVARPMEAPRVSVRGVRGWRVQLRLSDKLAPYRKSKPAGVSSAVLRFFVGDKPPAAVGDWQYQGTSSVTQLEVEVPTGLEPGTRVWYAACWQSPTFEPGPVGAPVCVRVGFSGLEGAAGPRAGAGGMMGTNPRRLAA